jgi:hypothetical protein
LKLARKLRRGFDDFAWGKKVQMNELGIATVASDKIVLAVTSHLNEGNIEDAVAIFADQFSFKDHGIRLEFNTKDRLAEFFGRRSNSTRTPSCKLKGYCE